MGLPKVGEYEYDYNYSDWYSQIQTQIVSHSKFDNRYVYGYKIYKSIQIIAHMCHYIQFIVHGT